MEDASLASDAPADRRISSTVRLREALGSDVLVHVPIDAPQAMNEHVKELVVDVGQEALDARAGTESGGSTVIARLNPRTGARVDEPIELLIDTRRMHFFDPGDGAAIYGDTAE